MTDKEAGKPGRPRLYETPEQMQEAIDTFFAMCEADNAKPTIAGLCYSLGFDDRHALQEYAKYDGFSATVKKARLRIEAFLEQKLFENNVTGVIFNLKNNFGWEDRNKHEHGGDGGGPIQFTTVYESKPK